MDQTPPADPRARPARAKPKFRRYTSEVRAAMLIEAGMACLARGGILGFTVDNICAEAGASRGLITHHFGSKDGLLAAIYAAMYDQALSKLTAPDGAPLALPELIEQLFAEDTYNRFSLNVWLALWGEIARNPALMAEHRRYYTLYRDRLARGIEAYAAATRRPVDAERLAVLVISIFDGLWLEQCIAPDLLSPSGAKDNCHAMLEAFLGPLPRP
jgi:TetR/AcrR family transcriptional regulator, transcriptional repressor of bet genes